MRPRSRPACAAAQGHWRSRHAQNATGSTAADGRSRLWVTLSQTRLNGAIQHAPCPPRRPASRRGRRGRYIRLPFAFDGNKAESANHGRRASTAPTALHSTIWGRTGDSNAPRAPTASTIWGRLSIYEAVPAHWLSRARHTWGFGLQLGGPRLPGRAPCPTPAKPHHQYDRLSTVVGS